MRRSGAPGARALHLLAELGGRRRLDGSSGGVGRWS